MGAKSPRGRRQRGFLLFLGLSTFALLVLVVLRFDLLDDSPVGKEEVREGHPTPRVSPTEVENRRPGTHAWHIPADAPYTIEGYANRVSAERGEEVALFVSTSAPRFRVVAYRVGYYQGLGGRLVWRSPLTEGNLQPDATRNPVTNMVEAPWRESLSFRVGLQWTPGAYLLKLKASDGGQSYVPLVVRDDESHAALVFQLGVTTWQAYNTWGGYSLYHGPVGGFETRARVVSFDRPYAQNRGGVELVGARERPLILLAERLGLDVTYWTDVDLHQRPELLLGHKALITLGKDEYWSGSMRAGAIRARDEGVNIAFFGADPVYRHIRFAPSPLGPDRRQIGYKVPEEDPLYGRRNAQVTGNWRSPPVPRPESVLTGVLYHCAGVQEDMVIADASSWLFAGTGLRNGDRLSDVVMWEYDSVDPSYPTPETIQILAHSPLICGGRRDYAHMAYYTAKSGAGVISTGTIGWVPALRCGGQPNPASEYPTCIPEVITVTKNVLRVFARGPAGLSHPSEPNLARFGLSLDHPIDV
jgi:hypothetical protein